MNYKDHYDKLIYKAKMRTEINQYTENHHIIPRCMGGTDTKDNLVRLTAREHFIAHQLLYKEYRTTKLAHAWFMMTVNGNGQERHVTSTQYKSAKLAHIKVLKESMKGSGNHFYSKKHTDETKAKISLANKGKKHTQEFKDNISTRWKGKPKPAEQRAKIGRKGLAMYQNKNTMEIRRVPIGSLDETIWVNPRKLNPEPKYKCDYCSKVARKCNLTRWHNENCKHK